MEEALTPGSPDGLPPLGDLIADEPFWRHPADAAGEGVARLRVWLTASLESSHPAVVTETAAAAVTEFTEHIWASATTGCVRFASVPAAPDRAVGRVTAVQRRAWDSNPR
jgi:hypothetical protein